MSSVPPVRKEVTVATTPARATPPAMSTPTRAGANETRLLTLATFMTPLLVCFFC